ncbi:SpaA isopeptide-forming pilin-related protein, partial [Fructobacillus tropaeoli]
MENIKSHQHYKLYKSGKFWVTAMVSALFLATTGATNGHHVHADELPADGRVSFASPDPIKGHITFSNGRVDPVLNIRVNDQVVFCINPFAHLRGGEYASSAQGQQDLTASYWKSLTKQQQNLINNAAYLAQAQGAATDSETYFAGQLVVWSLIAGQNGIPGVMNGSDKIDSSDLHNAIGATITGWDSNVVSSEAIAKAEQILQNAAAMGQRPDFSPAPLNILAGQSATVTDKNGVLQNFKNISGTDGINAVMNGNNLTINTSQNAQSGSLRLKNTPRELSQQPYYVYGTYEGNDLSNPQQPVFAAKDPSINTSELQVNVKKANLKIDKSILKNGGITTKDLTNGNYSLSGNVFEVHKDTADGEVVATVTTDANGDAETGNILAAGKYVVTEKQASQGLARTFNPVTVNVDSVDNLDVKASGSNSEVTGGITIQKTGAETGTQMWNDNYSLAGNIFKIHKDSINGEVVDTVTTNDKGQAQTKTDLPLGHYVVEEVQASKGFVKTFKPQDVDITYQGQEVPIVISATGGTNQEVKGQIIVDKSGAQSGKNMINGNYTLAGNEFDIVDEHGQVVDHVTTDASGKAYSKESLPLGTYKVIETKASQGFVKSATPQNVTLTYNGQQAPIVFNTAFETNQEVKGGITIQKTGAETGTKQWNANYSLAGNVFKIHKDSINGEVVDEVTTDANGYAKTKTDLPLGHYVVEEVQASKGFLKTFKPQDVDITYQGQNVPIVISATGGTNQEVKGQIIVDKSGAQSGKNMINGNYTLAGNEFDIFDEQNNLVDHVTTDASGKAYSKTDLKLGKYTVVETKASQGFVKSATPQKVDLSYVGQEVPVVFDTAYETNQEVKGGITIQKTGAETGTKQWNANYSLAGNVFKIHKDTINGEVVDEVTTDANGYAKTKTDLPLGHYVVEEVQASKGFLKTFKPQDVEITYQGQNVPIVISATGGTNQEVKGQIIVDKSGAQSGKNMINGNYTLAGNEFDIFDEQNNLVDHVTTDASGKAYSKTDLPLGKYTVVETKASQGFVKSATPQKVDLSYVGQEVPVVFDTAYETNQEVKGGITIQKTGAETGTKQWNDNYSLAGNVFKIHKDSINGEVVDEVTTDANGYAKTREDLPLGHYVVEEVQASKGFVKTFKPQDVDITYQGQNVPIVLSLTGGTNQEVKGKIVIDKSGSESKKTPWNSNYSLAGNVFDIHQDNALGKVVAQITTDANGHAETDANLPLGDYYVTESKASQGYVNSFTPQKVTLKYAGQEVALVADMAAGTNQEVTGSTSVIKQDKQTGDNSQGRATLSGAEYTLYHADGTPVKWSENGQPTPEITSGKQVSRDQVTLRIDDDLHEAGVKHLALGDYYWQETKAPEGYQLDGQKYNVAIKYQDQDTPVITQNETSKEQVINFSFDGFKYVQSPSGSSQSGYNGIQLSLIPINGTKGDKQTVTTETDANGYDGYYKFNNISYGDYELWEENAPEGYQHIEPLYVHIELNADKTAYVFTVTEKGQSVPLKKMIVPVNKINEGTGNVYLSKLFLFDKSEDTRKCNGGGNNQPVINVNNTNTNTNANSPVINNNPVVNTNSTSNGGQQHQQENQQQTGGTQTQDGKAHVTGGDQSQDGKANVTGGAQTQDGKTNVTSTPTVTGGAQTQDGKTNVTSTPTVTGGAQTQDGKTNVTSTPTVTGG